MWLFRRLLALILWLPIRSFLICACVTLVAYAFATLAFRVLPCPRPSLDPWGSLGGVAMLLGSLLNMVVFVANGFRMPVRCRTGEDEDRLQRQLLHRPLNDSSRLVFLADIIPFFGWASVGDLLVFSGLALVVTIGVSHMHAC